MPPKPTARSRHASELRVARLATAQHGVVTRTQLLAAGVSSDGIKHRISTGRLHQMHRGVYAVAYLPRGNPFAAAIAAVLACGPEAVVSHRSAAALWEIGPPPEGPVEVSAPGKHHHPAIRHHRARIDPRQITARHRIPVTTLPRTLLDLAAVVDERALTRAFNDAQILHRLPVSQVERLVDGNGGRAGVRLLVRVLDQRQSPTRSAFEDDFVAFVKRHGLPSPEINQLVAGYEVDMLWPQERLVAELDGRRFHTTVAAFERDRKRDADLTAAGYRVLRITWRRLVEEPAAEAARLRVLLGPGSHA